MELRSIISLPFIGGGGWGGAPGYIRFNCRLISISGLTYAIAFAVRGVGKNVLMFVMSSCLFTFPYRF